MLPANKKTELQTKKYDKQKKIPTKGKKSQSLYRENLFFLQVFPLPRTETLKKERKNERQSAEQN